MADALTGDINTVTGKVKETAGAATNDRSMQAGGMFDQLKGSVQKAMAPGVDGQPQVVGQAKAFARERPWATAALVGVLGLATLGTLRGKG
ncbi:CsbD family protein [Sphingomonas sp. CCH5-D11]|uniref:CsbD family protein n=1 Tax=Sphingomonas sp. CCH5-D11 TaxID=1768786 RepID=UPI00082F611B|nr:CsbD family protein [Sphingomonas sp. CCH5-D11]